MHDRLMGARPREHIARVIDRDLSGICVRAWNREPHWRTKSARIAGHDIDAANVFHATTASPAD